MKKINLLSLLSVLTLFSYACHNNQDDPTKYVDKPIKVVITKPENEKEEYVLEYDEQYRLIKSTEKDYIGEEVTGVAIDQYTYNDHGNILTHIRTDDGEEEINITRSYDYDDKGNIIKEIQTGSDTHKFIFKYDSLNRIELKEIYNNTEATKDPDEWYAYTYINDYKDYETMKWYRPIPFGDEPAQTIVNTFNEKGLIIESKDDHITGYTKTTYNVYDSYDNLVNITVIDDKEKDVTTKSYYKNNPDKPLKIIEEDFDIGSDTPMYKSTHDYEYDTHDRTKKETLNDNGDIITTEYFYEFE